MRKELLKDLTDEQIAKVKECKNTSDLLELAKNEGVQLTNEQLEAVNGGGCFSTFKCPYCGSEDYKKVARYQVSGSSTYQCNKCGKEWSL